MSKTNQKEAMAVLLLGLVALRVKDSNNQIVVTKNDFSDSFNYVLDGKTEGEKFRITLSHDKDKVIADRLNNLAEMLDDNSVIGEVTFITTAIVKKYLKENNVESMTINAREIEDLLTLGLPVPTVVGNDIVVVFKKADKKGSEFYV